MTVSKPELTPTKTSPVSKYFRRDWQFLVDIVRTPLVKEASATIAATPALVNLSWFKEAMGSTVSPTIWVTWIAAILYLLFFGLVRFRCPAFIFEYRDFGEYKKRQHSARFIGWELKAALVKLADPKLVDELIEKGLAEVAPDGAGSKISAAGIPKLSVGDYTIIGPNNVGVDLFLYFRKSDKLYRMKFDDSEIFEESTFERNVFWVIYTRLTKHMSWTRYAAWALFNLAILTFAASVLLNIAKALGDAPV